MRNQEATNQVYVGCEINPPVDVDQEGQCQDQDHKLEVNADKPETTPLLNLPPATSALPTLRAPAAHDSASVLDPMMEMARKTYRTPSGRIMSAQPPLPLSELPRPPAPPPPRSALPLLKPPKTPPPIPKGVTPGHEVLKLAFPRTLASSPMATQSLISPPSSPPAPKLMPRDKRRSPQASVIMQGHILPPSTPTLAGPAPYLRLPTPPSSNAILLGHGMYSSPNVADVTATQLSMQKSSGTEEKGSDENSAFPARAHNTSEAHSRTQAVDNDGKGLESHDEFEDAEKEVMARPSEDKVKQRESKQGSTERASRLMGNKMLQGWAMLQKTCPNLACNCSFVKRQATKKPWSLEVSYVPLMRSLEKKAFCVLCETYYLDGQDLEQGKHTIVPSPASPPVAAAVAAAASIQTVIVDPVRPTFSSSTLKTTSQPLVFPTTMAPVATSRSPTTIFRTISPISSPVSSRPQRDLNGRISGPIVLPPPAPMSPSFGMTCQQVLRRYHSEDLNKLGIDEEEMKRHMQLIGRVNEFSSRSLPPVPPVPAVHSTSVSRPTSTYSNSSDKERHRRLYSSSHHLLQHNPGPSAPVPPSAEIQAIVDATHSTMATLLTKLEVYRLALEMTESPKESQLLAQQIKGLMECLKACRDVL
ncbi:hypothetical protein EDD11_005291 [Mortierella claussenii]|nr:hypothetical protein EDD11_005291 [Mortierella claussenii]